MRRKVTIALAIVAGVLVHDALYPAISGYMAQWGAERAQRHVATDVAVPYDNDLAARFRAALADAECAGGCGITGVTNSTLTLTGNNVAVTDPLTIGVINVSTNLVATSTTNGQGQLRSGNAAADANLPGAIVYGSGGMIEQGTTCSANASNASPSLATTTQFKCFINASSGSATATVYTITLPTTGGARTNAPDCRIDYVAGASQTSLPTCSVSTANPAVATVTFGVAPTTTGRFFIDVTANGS